MTADPEARVPGYAVEKTFGDIRVLRREAGGAVRRWREYAPTIDGGVYTGVMRRLYPDAPAMPPDSGIRFADEDAQGR